MRRKVQLTPEGRARRDALEREIARLELLYKEDQRELLVELAGVGLQVNSVWDLVNSKEPYPLAVPILFRHLSVPHLDRVREGIARALTVKETRNLWQELKTMYLQEPEGTDAKSGMAVALGGIADDARLDDVLAILADADHGSSRILFLQALRRSKLAIAKENLRRFSEWPEFAKEIKSWSPRRRR